MSVYQHIFRWMIKLRDAALHNIRIVIAATALAPFLLNNVHLVFRCSQLLIRQHLFTRKNL